MSNNLKNLLKTTLLSIFVLIFFISPNYFNQQIHADSSGPFNATNDGGVTCTYTGTQYPDNHYNLTLQFQNNSSQAINTFISFTTNGNPGTETMSAPGWTTEQTSSGQYIDSASLAPGDTLPITTGFTLLSGQYIRYYGYANNSTDVGGCTVDGDTLASQISGATPTPTLTPTPTPTPTPGTTTLTPSQDAYIQHNAQNANEGAASFLELSYEGKERALVQFDQSQIAAAVVGDPNFTATLQLNIVSNNNNWGSSGRQIDVNRMEQSWTQGNGSYKENGNRGTGLGVTWDCATDSNITNDSTNCSGSTAWDMIDSGSWPFDSTPTATGTISNGQSGTVSFDVTSDVQSFLNDTNINDGWIIKKDNETQGGDVQFGSSNGSYSPKLIITPH